VTTFSDSTLGERGIIYKAAGFQPVGASRGGRRVLVRYQAKLISERSAAIRHRQRTATRQAGLQGRDGAQATVLVRVPWHAATAKGAANVVDPSARDL
jgi:hypothetical protein